MFEVSESDGDRYESIHLPKAYVILEMQVILELQECCQIKLEVLSCIHPTLIAMGKGDNNETVTSDVN